MNYKSIIGILIFAIGGIYITAILNNPLAFIIFLPFALLIFLISFILFVERVFYKFISSEKKEIYDLYRDRIIGVTIIGIIMFLIGIKFINLTLLSEKFYFINILFYFLMLIFIVFLGRFFVKPSKKIFLYVIISGVIFLASIVGAKNYFSNSPVRADSEEKISSLSYLSYVAKNKKPDQEGVTIFKEDLCSKGINIFNLCRKPGAYLVDMEGEVLHHWMPKRTASNWHHVEMCRNGDLLVVIKDVRLTRLDWNSEVRWRKAMRAHHDIAIAENGDIYVLYRKDEIVFKYGIPLPILNDYVVILSPKGKLKNKISFYKILKEKFSYKKVVDIYKWLIKPSNFILLLTRQKNKGIIFVNNTPADILHVNTVELIDRNIEGICKKGNILFASYMLDFIGIYDIEKERLLWGWGKGRVQNPHHPTLLKNNNILIFDNGNRRKYSRVVELDPHTGKIEWQYKGTPPKSFFASWGGANQRLPNGNTLITESTQGRVFEVTKEGKIVWEFYNPVYNKNGKRVTIYRMMRITNFSKYPFLKELQRKVDK